MNKDEPTQREKDHIDEARKWSAFSDQYFMDIPRERYELYIDNFNDHTATTFHHGGRSLALNKQALIELLWDDELEASKERHRDMMERLKTEAPGPDSFPAHVINIKAEGA